MNRMRWKDASVPLEVLALKLGEEAAEVGTEISDAIMESREVDTNRILVEIEHTQMLLDIIRARILDTGA